MGLDFTSLMNGYFALYFYKYFDRLYVVYMTVLSRVFYAAITLVMYVFYDCRSPPGCFHSTFTS